MEITISGMDIYGTNDQGATSKLGHLPLETKLKFVAVEPVVANN